MSKGGLKALNIYLDLGDAALEGQRRDPTFRGQKDRLWCYGAAHHLSPPTPSWAPILMRQWGT